MKAFVSPQIAKPFLALLAVVSLIAACPSGQAISGTFTLSGGVAQAAIIVDTANDLVANEGRTSLREAIALANSQAGADTIGFNIPGAGVHTIQLNGSLPPITGVNGDGTIIDGYTQPGASANTLLVGNNAVLRIEIKGEGPGASTPDAITIRAANCAVRGLVINNARYGIYINGSAATGNTVAGNFLGTDATGSSAVGNLLGVQIEGAAENLVGGSTVGARNIASGNNSAGIRVTGVGATGNQISGNYAGTDASGALAIPNSTGVSVANGEGTLIGGSIPAARNVLSGNIGLGLSLAGVNTRHNRVIGNFIGTNATGTAAVGNGGGLQIYEGANNTIGGAVAAARNVISGNQFEGLSMEAAIGNVVWGNYIGTDVTGTSAIPNSAGILIGIAYGNFIGGTQVGAGNTIAFNNYFGLAVQGDLGTGNAIRGNSFFNNGLAAPSLSIDLQNPVGVNANDAGDADSGSNNRQNFPVLSISTVSGGNTVINGTLNSSTNTTYAIDFYSSPTRGLNGLGDCKRYLGTTSVATGGDGNASFSATLSGVIVPHQHFITATATRTSATSSTGATNDTSELSAPRQNVNINPPRSAADTYIGAEDTTLTVNAAKGVLANDTDDNGDLITAVLVSTTATGNLTLNADGSFTYVPAANASGPVTFTYKANDGALDGNTVTVTINIVAEANLPTISAIADQTIAQGSSTGELPFIIGDNTTPAANLTLSKATSNPLLAPLSGIVIGGSGANRTVTVTPNPVQSGSATITITVTDSDGATASESFTLMVIPRPNITVVNPSAGGVGTTVGISGSNYNVPGGVTSVTFNGIAATFTRNGSLISAIVPPGNINGPIRVTTGGGTAVGPNNFVLLPTPQVLAFSPAEGGYGTLVSFSGNHLGGATTVRLNGVNVPGFTVANNNLIRFTIPNNGRTGKISVVTPGGIGVSANDFTVYPAPQIGSFKPTAASIGTIISISGNFFDSVQSVRFNNQFTSNFVQVTDHLIRVAVPAGAATGKITVTTKGGSAISADIFTVVQSSASASRALTGEGSALASLGIASFTPASGPVGTLISISGHAFTGATTVRFNDVPAEFTVLSATKVEAAVPVGATSGVISVTSSGGSANSTVEYIVTR